MIKVVKRKYEIRQYMASRRHAASGLRRRVHKCTRRQCGNGTSPRPSRYRRRSTSRRRCARAWGSRRRRSRRRRSAPCATRRRARACARTRGAARGAPARTRRAARCWRRPAGRRGGEQRAHALGGRVERAPQVVRRRVLQQHRALRVRREAFVPLARERGDVQPSGRASARDRCASEDYAPVQ